MAQMQTPNVQMPPSRAFTFHLDFEGLGWLTIDVPDAPVNTLSRETLAELAGIVTALDRLRDKHGGLTALIADSFGQLLE